MIDTWRGKLRVRKWPKKRGKPKSPATQFMNAWFRDAQQKMNYVDGRAMDFAISATRQTGLYPRDLMLRAASRGMFIIDDPERGLLSPRPQGVWTVAFQGLITQLASNLTLPAGVNVTVPWPAPSIDSAAFWDAAQPTRWTIPPGVNIVNLIAGFRQGSSAGGRIAVGFLKNGAFLTSGDNASSTGTRSMSYSTGPITVAPGDYFEAQFFSSNATSALAGATSFGSLEVLDASLPFNP
jgi:hypothetical protein